MAEETGILEDSRRFAKMSLCASFLGVCGGIILMIILVAVFVGGAGTVGTATGAGALAGVAAVEGAGGMVPGAPNQNANGQMPQGNFNNMNGYNTASELFGVSPTLNPQRRQGRSLHGVQWEGSPAVEQSRRLARQHNRQVPIQPPGDNPTLDSAKSNPLLQRGTVDRFVLIRKIAARCQN